MKARVVKKTTKTAATKVAAPVKETAPVAETKAVEEKKETVKETVKEEVKEVVEAKAEVKKAAKATKTETAKTAEKKPAAKKTTTTKKETLKANITLQFSGKDYKEEDFVKIAKDVWQYDLNNKPADLKTVELYVKPEEGLCYYVMNGDVKGSFAI